MIVGGVWPIGGGVYNTLAYKTKPAIINDQGTLVLLGRTTNTKNDKDPIRMEP